jgi:N6-adenosine-specific RNA methylase IME4
VLCNRVDNRRHLSLSRFGRTPPYPVARLDGSFRAPVAPLSTTVARGGGLHVLGAIMENGRAYITDSLAKLAGRNLQIGTVYADPPWRYGNQTTRAATGKHYKTMSTKDLRTMPIETLVQPKAHLHLWTTNGFIGEAIALIGAWGFEYKSCFVWCKPSMGIGNYWRVSHEFLLLGVRGGATFANRSLRSWAELPRAEHSRKPEIVRKWIESASPGPDRLELFGRRAAHGWGVFGDEVTTDLLTSEITRL